MPVCRRAELRRRRTRRKKLAQLRRRYREAKSKEEKAKILEKVSRVAPGITLQ
ncbi:MAG: DUF6800 family protein [Candidatus Binatia bacterium]